MKENNKSVRSSLQLENKINNQNTQLKQQFNKIHSVLANINNQLQQEERIEQQIQCGLQQSVKQQTKISKLQQQTILLQDDKNNTESVDGCFKATAEFVNPNFTLHNAMRFNSSTKKQSISGGNNDSSHQNETGPQFYHTGSSLGGDTISFRPHQLDNTNFQVPLQIDNKGRLVLDLTSLNSEKNITLMQNMQCEPNSQRSVKASQIYRQNILNSFRDNQQDIIHSTRTQIKGKYEHILNELNSQKIQLSDVQSMKSMYSQAQDSNFSSKMMTTECSQRDNAIPQPQILNTSKLISYSSKPRLGNNNEIMDNQPQSVRNQQSIIPKLRLAKKKHQRQSQVIEKYPVMENCELIDNLGPQMIQDSRRNIPCNRSMSDLTKQNTDSVSFQDKVSMMFDILVNNPRQKQVFVRKDSVSSFIANESNQAYSSRPISQQNLQLNNQSIVDYQSENFPDYLESNRNFQNEVILGNQSHYDLQSIRRDFVEPPDDVISQGHLQQLGKDYEKKGLYNLNSNLNSNNSRQSSNYRFEMQKVESPVYKKILDSKQTIQSQKDDQFTNNQNKKQQDPKEFSLKNTVQFYKQSEQSISHDFIDLESKDSIKMDEPKQDTKSQNIQTMFSATKFLSEQSNVNTPVISSGRANFDINFKEFNMNRILENKNVDYDLPEEKSLCQINEFSYQKNARATNNKQKSPFAKQIYNVESSRHLSNKKFESVFSKRKQSMAVESNRKTFRQSASNSPIEGTTPEQNRLRIKDQSLVSQRQKINGSISTRKSLDHSPEIQLQRKSTKLSGHHNSMTNLMLVNQNSNQQRPQTQLDMNHSPNLLNKDLDNIICSQQEFMQRNPSQNSLGKSIQNLRHKQLDASGNKYSKSTQKRSNIVLADSIDIDNSFIEYLRQHQPLEEVVMRDKTPINDYQKKKWELEEKQKHSLMKKLEQKYQKIQNLENEKIKSSTKERPSSKNTKTPVKNQCFQNQEVKNISQRKMSCKMMKPSTIQTVEKVQNEVSQLQKSHSKTIFSRLQQEIQKPALETRNMQESLPNKQVSISELNTIEIAMPTNTQNKSPFKSPMTTKSKLVTPIKNFQGIDPILSQYSRQIQVPQFSVLQQRKLSLGKLSDNKTTPFKNQVDLQGNRRQNIVEQQSQKNLHISQQKLACTELTQNKEIRQNQQQFNQLEQSLGKITISDIRVQQNNKIKSNHQSAVKPAKNNKK